MYANAGQNVLFTTVRGTRAITKAQSPSYAPIVLSAIICHKAFVIHSTLAAFNDHRYCVHGSKIMIVQAALTGTLEGLTMAFGEMRTFGENEDVHLVTDSMFFIASFVAISLTATP